MQVSQILLDANGEANPILTGDFIKIEDVPSGNLLSIKTQFSSPLPEFATMGGTPPSENENESFIGTTGRSIKFDNQFQRLQISGGAANEEITIQTGFGWMLDTAPPVNIPPTPYQSEPILVGVTLTPIGISPEIDYKYAVLTIRGYDPGATIELETFDEFGFLLSSVPIYNTDGSPFTTTRAVTPVPPGPFGTNYYTIIVPMMGAKQLKLTAGGAGGGFTVSGSFTNNWN